MAKKTSKKKAKLSVKTDSDKRSEQAFKITSKIKESNYETLLCVRSGMIDV